MVPFAGYSLPVQYKEGVLQSHLHTRADDSASLFDVGHMGQIRWHGKDALKFLETLVVGDLASLKSVRYVFELLVYNDEHRSLRVSYESSAFPA